MSIVIDMSKCGSPTFYVLGGGEAEVGPERDRSPLHEGANRHGSHSLFYPEIVISRGGEKGGPIAPAEGNFRGKRPTAR